MMTRGGLAVLALLAAAPAWAQRIFDDNQLRQGILDYDKELRVVTKEINNLRDQVGRLQIEAEELQSLIEGLRGDIAAAQQLVTGRQQNIDAGAAQLQDAMAQASKQRDRRRQELQHVLDSQEAVAYRDALGQPPTEAMAALKRIASSSSSYSGAAQFWLGKLQHGTGDLVAARASLRAFVDEHAGDARAPEALYLLADIAVKVDNDSDSSWRSMLLRVHPDSFYAEQLR